MAATNDSEKESDQSMDVQMTSEMGTFVTIESALDKLESDSGAGVSYEDTEHMLVEEQHVIQDTSDSLLQSVVLGSSAEGEVITADMDDEDILSGSDDQPTYLLVQQSEGQGQEGTITEAQTADGSIIQLRSIPSIGSIQNLQAVKAVQKPAIKRQAQTSGQGTVTKVIISGGGGGTAKSSQPMVISTSSPSSTQTIKLISTSPGSSSGSRAITLAQAQQMGLISSPKVQITSAATPIKQNIIVNKVMSPSKLSSPKITMVQQGAKSPTKILPAPGGSGLLKPSVASVAQINTSMGNLKQLAPGPQKIIIRQAGTSLQGAFKQGTVLSPGSGGQILRIPATQNIVSNVGDNQTVQIQQGKQVQYLRLVSSPQSSSPGTSKKAGTTLLPVKQTIAPAPVKMVPIAPANSGIVRSVTPKTQGNLVSQKLVLPAASTSSPQQMRQVTQVSQVTPAAVTQLGGTLVPTAGGNFMVLPAQIYDQLQASPRMPTVEYKVKEKTTPRLVDTTPRTLTPKQSLEANGIRPRKPCNCTKSQCLKLYCDCFANGEFCNNCNCNTCFNNLEHEEDRQKAIRACLERNPQAFKPKIGKTQVGDERRHNKGCNCRRSGCLKNYCECYEAKIPCTHMCKCIGCRNVEDNEERKLDRENVVLAAGLRARQQHMYAANRSRLSSGKRGKGAAAANHGLSRQPFGFMNQRLVEATCECLLAQAKQGEDAREEGEAEEGEGAGPDDVEIERRILEEYGTCLKQFIECSTKLETSL